MKNYGILFLLFGILLFASNCRKENFFTDTASLNFDRDTIYFDTVFTRLPGSTFPRSINKKFVIKNPYNDWIKASIKLAGGQNSVYRINVDGIPTTDLKDYEIRPKDSIFVFVECTLEPNNLTMPALVRDSILINTNGKIQQIQLAAYGWDAYYYNDEFVDCNSVWDKTDKPYVIVNSVGVKENCTFEIKKGITVYSSSTSKFVVLGTLKINGTADDPVTFRAARLDRNFDDVAGQWIGLHFYRFSKDSEINHAVIKNAIIGVRVDSLSINSNPKLSIRKSTIKNCSNSGVLGITADITMENSVITNCNAYTFIGYWGGNYILKHNTFANYNIGFIRNDPHFVLNNNQINDNKVIIRNFNSSLVLQNSIIYGTNEDEINLDIDTNNRPSLLVIENNVIRTKGYPELGVNSLNYLNTGHQEKPFFKDLLFENIQTLNHELDSSSAANDKGKTIFPPILFDHDNLPRNTPPDIGAYENKH